MWATLMSIGLGGAIGATSRHILRITLEKGLVRHFEFKNIIFQAFPFPTFIINILGSFCLGYLLSKWQEYFGNEASDSDKLYQFFVIGLLSSFTTFSTFSMEIHGLITDKNYMMTCLYIMASLIFSVLAFMWGLSFLRTT